MAEAGLAEALRAAERRAGELAQERRLAEALAIYERLVAVAPDELWVRVQQGRVLLLGDDCARALAHFEDLTRRFPQAEAAWQGLGKACCDQQRCDAAVAAFTRAAELSRAPALALYHRGMAHLLAGRFGDGWRDYQRRLAAPALRPRVFDRPLWDGKPLAGRRLLVLCEQGYGDVFQFIRYLPLLRAQDGPVVFECPAELRTLLDPLLGGIEVVPLAGRQPPATPFDCHVHLMSLPLFVGRAPDQIPCDVPYLHVEVPAPRRAAAGLRVGVCWAGSPTHPQDLQRSMAPEFLAPLARLPGVTLVSLQKPSRDWSALPGLAGFLQASPLPLSDFMSTARAIAGLDLVISVDTAVAHLAGALGRPVWLLLCSAGEWRWLVERGDSPWYPTLRIFRQRRLGAWADLVGDVATALAGFTPR